MKGCLGIKAGGSSLYNTDRVAGRAACCVHGNPKVVDKLYKGGAEVRSWPLRTIEMTLDDPGAL
jgi:hypothetical protein